MLKYDYVTGNFSPSDQLIFNKGCLVVLYCHSVLYNYLAESHEHENIIQLVVKIINRFCVKN